MSGGGRWCFNCYDVTHELNECTLPLDWPRIKFNQRKYLPKKKSYKNEQQQEGGVSTGPTVTAPTPAAVRPKGFDGVPSGGPGSVGWGKPIDQGTPWEVVRQEGGNNGGGGGGAYGGAATATTPTGQWSGGGGGAPSWNANANAHSGTSGNISRENSWQGAPPSDGRDARGSYGGGCPGYGTGTGYGLPPPQWNLDNNGGSGWETQANNARHSSSGGGGQLWGGSGGQQTEAPPQPREQPANVWTGRPPAPIGINFGNNPSMMGGGREYQDFGNSGMMHSNFYGQNQSKMSGPGGFGGQQGMGGDSWRASRPPSQIGAPGHLFGPPPPPQQHPRSMGPGQWYAPPPHSAGPWRPPPPPQATGLHHHGAGGPFTPHPAALNDPTVGAASGMSMPMPPGMHVGVADSHMSWTNPFSKKTAQPDKGTNARGDPTVQSDKRWKTNTEGDILPALTALPPPMNSQQSQSGGGAGNGNSGISQAQQQTSASGAWKDPSTPTQQQPKTPSWAAGGGETVGQATSSSPPSTGGGGGGWGDQPIVAAQPPMPTSAPLVKTPTVYDRDGITTVGWGGGSGTKPTDVSRNSIESDGENVSDDVFGSNPTTPLSAGAGPPGQPTMILNKQQQQQMPPNGFGQANSASNQNLNQLVSKLGNQAQRNFSQQGTGGTSTYAQTHLLTQQIADQLRAAGLIDMGILHQPLPHDTLFRLNQLLQSVPKMRALKDLLLSEMRRTQPQDRNPTQNQEYQRISNEVKQLRQTMANLKQAIMAQTQSPDVGQQQSSQIRNGAAAAAAAGPNGGPDSATSKLEQWKHGATNSVMSTPVDVGGGNEASGGGNDVDEDNDLNYIAELAGGNVDGGESYGIEDEILSEDELLGDQSPLPHESMSDKTPPTTGSISKIVEQQRDRNGRSPSTATRSIADQTSGAKSLTRPPIDGRQSTALDATDESGKNVDASEPMEQSNGNNEDDDDHAEETGRDEASATTEDKAKEIESSPSNKERPVENGEADVSNTSETVNNNDDEEPMEIVEKKTEAEADSVDKARDALLERFYAYCQKFRTISGSLSANSVRERFRLTDLLKWFLDEEGRPGPLTFRKRLVKTGFSLPISITMPPSQVVDFIAERAADKSLKDIYGGRKAVEETPEAIAMRQQFSRYAAPNMTRFLYDIGYNLVSEATYRTALTRAVTELSGSSRSADAAGVQRQADMVEHIRRVYDDVKKQNQSLKLKLHRCPIDYCDFAAETKLQLHDHQRQPHKKAHRWECAICRRFSSQTKRELDKHLKDEHGFPWTTTSTKPKKLSSGKDDELDVLNLRLWPKVDERRTPAPVQKAQRPKALPAMLRPMTKDVHGYSNKSGPASNDRPSTSSANTNQHSATSQKQLRYCCTPCDLKFAGYEMVLKHSAENHLKPLHVPLCRIEKCEPCQEELSGKRKKKEDTIGDGEASGTSGDADGGGPSSKIARLEDEKEEGGDGGLILDLDLPEYEPEAEIVNDDVQVIPCSDEVITLD